MIEVPLFCFWGVGCGQVILPRSMASGEGNRAPIHGSESSGKVTLPQSMAVRPPSVTAQMSAPASCSRFTISSRPYTAVSGSRVPGFGFRVQDFVLRVSGAGDRISGTGLRVSGLANFAPGLVQPLHNLQPPVHRCL